MAFTRNQYAIEEMQHDELQKQQAMAAEKINNQKLKLHKVTTSTLPFHSSFIMQIYNKY